MKNNEIEALLLSEMKEVTGGSATKSCICDNGGAGETVIVQQPQSSSSNDDTRGI